MVFFLLLIPGKQVVKFMSNNLIYPHHQSHSFLKKWYVPMFSRLKCVDELRPPGNLFSTSCKAETVDG